MSIFGAMNAGVSGLGAQSQSLGMIADNIANVNTIGYKGVVARFSSLVTQSGTSSFHSPGGVQSNAFKKVDAQGLVQTSSSKTDLAVAGAGMFVVTETSGGSNFLFTRDGSFLTDKNGNLVNSTGGHFLQGWPIDINGNIPTTTFQNLATVNTAGLTATARATTTMDMAANLPAGASVNTLQEISIPLFDGQGANQQLDYYWVKTATNQWLMSGYIPASGQFAADDTPTAALSDTTVALPVATNFGFTSATGGVTGAFKNITTTKTDPNTVVVSVDVGSDTFTKSYALTNELPSTADFNYTSSTSGVDGSVTAVTVATVGTTTTITATIGGTVYTGTLTTDGGAGVDISNGTVVTLTNGAESLVITANAGISYDLDGGGNDAALDTDIENAFGGLPATGLFSSGSIVDGTAEIALGATMTLTALNGKTVVLTVPGAGAATYDLQSDTAVTLLDTNLTAATNGAVLVNNALAVPLANVTFDANGIMTNITSASTFASVNTTNNVEFYVDYDNDATTTSTADRKLITLDLGTLNTLDGMKQFAGAFFVSQIDQNGVKFGNFTGVEVSEKGVVIALFDNGTRKDVFQLPLAMFPNFNGMEAKSGNAFQETAVSGAAQLLLPETAGAGAIASSALEASTVDIADEFTKMIVTQRAYSASAKIITTADQMLEELLRIR